jgi:GH15 family glucan-1,4-alpha-glucosidase
MWSTVVVGTHPIEADQQVWLEVWSDEVSLGALPAYWLENKGVNSLWHVPVPPLRVGARMRYRACARRGGSEPVCSGVQEALVRPNAPDPSEVAAVDDVVPEGLVGNRMMTVKVDPRGATYDIYFPTVGLHSDVRPAEGELARSRSHFRLITGGLALTQRLEWFCERRPWEVRQRYLEGTNHLETELSWRSGPIRVLVTDFAVMGTDLPRTAGGNESPGQCFKRFRIINRGGRVESALFGVYVQAEVNGGIGETGLSWYDSERALVASNRGHIHSNRKLARDATIEFALALDERGESFCEPTGANEAMILRWVELPPGGETKIDLLVSGAFTGWSGDSGTFEHWLRPALEWFRSVDLDKIEEDAARRWREFGKASPSIAFPHSRYERQLHRATLAAALHTDARWGAIVSGYDRGINAYCWPRDAVHVSGALDRCGQPAIGQKVFDWLARVRTKERPFTFWFHKYTVDGFPEWETPAVDQTAVIPWGLERLYRRTGDLEFVAMHWTLIEQAATVCQGQSGHPGLMRLDDLHLVTSASSWDTRFGAFFYPNVCVVAGLRAAARLARKLGRDELAASWDDVAERTWNDGLLANPDRHPTRAGSVDPESGRFLEARRVSTRNGLWTDQPEYLIDRSAALEIGLLSPVVPFGLLPARDERVLRSAQALLAHNLQEENGVSGLLLRTPDPKQLNGPNAPTRPHRGEVSCLATLWMVRYLLQLGRETGEPKHWAQAITLLDSLLDQLGPLTMIPHPERTAPDARGRGLSGVWGLHASLMETLLDLAGLDYDAGSRALFLEPILPIEWPSIGLEHSFPSGRAKYRLQRSLGAGVSYRLELETTLESAIELRAGISCPDLTELAAWEGPTPRSEFDPQSRLLSWSCTIPAGASRQVWVWG